MADLSHMYREIIMEHYKHPRNKGLVDKEGYNKHRIKNPSCGDDITIQSKVEDGIVKDIRQDGSGCSICCASASVLTEKLKGMDVSEAEHFADAYLDLVAGNSYDESLDFGESKVFEGVRKFPSRIKCASIPWKAFKKTIE